MAMDILDHGSCLDADSNTLANKTQLETVGLCVSGIRQIRCLPALVVALPHARTAEDYEALLPWSIAMMTH